MDAQVGPHEEGFVVYTREGDGCGRGNHIYDHVMLVRHDQSLSTLETDRIERGDPHCHY